MARAAKAAVDAASGPLAQGLAQENSLWAQLFAEPAADALIRAGLAAGAQTPAGERNLEGLLSGL